MEYSEARRVLLGDTLAAELRARETRRAGAPDPMWEQRFAKLARERAWELSQLSERLEGISVTFDLERVSLDLRTRELVLAGRLGTHGSLAPEVVWLFAYFLHPDHPVGSWSHTPIRLNQPFAQADRVDIEERAHAHWLSDPELPNSGYLARVTVVGHSSFDAAIPPRFRNLRTEGATPVEIMGGGER